MDFTRTQVPLPPTVRKPHVTTIARKSKYNFGSMKIGDSDLTTDIGPDESKAISRISSAIAVYKKKTKDNRRFVVRIYDHEENGTTFRVLGVWCLAPNEKKAKAENAAEGEKPADAEATEQASPEQAEAVAEQASEPVAEAHPGNTPE